MENDERKVTQVKTQKVLLVAQICMRVFVIAATLASACIIFTSQEIAIVYGLPFAAKYSYSSTFRFFAFANIFVCAFTLISLLYAFIAGRKGATPSNYFFLFLGDLCMMILALSACSAATAEGNLGKYGNSHAGWLPICKYLHKFCNKVTTSVVLSFASFIILLVLTVLSASRSRHIHV